MTTKLFPQLHEQKPEFVPPLPFGLVTRPRILLSQPDPPQLIVGACLGQDPTTGADQASLQAGVVEELEAQGLVHSAGGFIKPDCYVEIFYATADFFGLEGGTGLCDSLCRFWIIEVDSLQVLEQVLSRRKQKPFISYRAGVEITQIVLTSPK